MEKKYNFYHIQVVFSGSNIGGIYNWKVSALSEDEAKNLGKEIFLTKKSIYFPEQTIERINVFFIETPDFIKLLGPGVIEDY